jgi:hypothetical protein
VPDTHQDEARNVRSVELESYLPPDTPVYYADNLIVGPGQGVVMLSFMQAELPLISDPEEWAQITKIPSKCVARIVISHSKYPEFVDALRRSVRGLDSKENGDERTNLSAHQHPEPD